MNKQNNQRKNVTDILCIGAQKSSTSWLHHVLNAHERTYAFPNSKPVTSTNKEAHFWDWNHHRGVKWYKTLMTPPDASLLTMDFTPEYAMLPDPAIAECKELSPTARVIYILRDPLARAVSAVRMYTKWRTQDAKPEDVRVEFDQDFVDILEKGRMEANSSYVANYTRWHKYYKDILVLNYEDILEKPADVIKQVFEHCGLSVDDLSGEHHKQFETRMTKKVWKSMPYQLSKPCVYFLHGLTWRKRAAIEAKFGFHFEEYKEFATAIQRLEK